MAQTRSLPRICIALGLPDVPTCWSTPGAKPRRAKHSWNSAWISWTDPARARRPFAAFLEQFPGLHRAGHLPPPSESRQIQRQHRRATRAFWIWRSTAGAHAIDIEIETAEVAPGRLPSFRGRAQVIVSYHNFEATPPMDTVVSRMMQVPADAYKVVTTARKPSDNVRVLARRQGAAQAAA